MFDIVVAVCVVRVGMLDGFVVISDVLVVFLLILVVIGIGKGVLVVSLAVLDVIGVVNGAVVDLKICESPF